MNNSRLIFNLSAFVELATGLALLAKPEQIVLLLLGSGLEGVALSLARILGLALFSLGIAVWQSQSSTELAPRMGICLYNCGAAALLTALGVLYESGGILLWPVAILHAILGIVMAWFIYLASSSAARA